MKLVVDELPKDKEDCMFCKVHKTGGKHDASGYPESKEYFCKLTLCKNDNIQYCKGVDCPYLVGINDLNK